MTAPMIKAINVPRMTRVTWYKHRASVLGIAGLFLLAAALLTHQLPPVVSFAARQPVR